MKNTLHSSLNERFRLRDWRVALQDLFSTKHHSHDFCGTRAEYMCARIRLFSVLFVLMSLLWIPVDFFTLNADEFTKILLFRLIFSSLFLIQAFWVPALIDLSVTYAKLLVFFLVPAFFYIAARLILNDAVEDAGIVQGYIFFPYLMVALMGVFPMTLLEGIFFAMLSSFPLIFIEIHKGTLLTLKTIGEIWLLGLLIGIAIWIQLSQLHMLLRLYREATLDPLTGLVNRRALIKWIDLEIEKAEINHYPLSILLFDLDKFKQINDTYGHLTGDIVLRDFGRLLNNMLVERHLIGRYGGEEFIAILPGMDLEQATEVAEHIRNACREQTIQSHEGHSVHFTSSIGVAEHMPDESLDTFIARVDQGLYQAKEGGRDMVVQAPSRI